MKGFETFGSFDYFFPSDDSGADITYWEANANLVYRVDAGSHSTTPYVGTGLNIAYTKVSTNALGGEVSGTETQAGSIYWEASSSNWGASIPFWKRDSN